MKKTFTKNAKRLFTLFVAIASFTAFAQTNNELKTTKDIERGEALKTWFGKGDIIVDASVETRTWVETGINTGYRCYKVKINNVLKGNIKTGYINIKTLGGKPNVIQTSQGQSEIITTDGVNDIETNGRYIITIQKTNLNKEGYTTTNTGVYETLGENLPLIEGYEISFKGFDKKYVFQSENDLYKSLQDYCGVKAKPLSPAKQSTGDTFKKWFEKGNIIIDGNIEDKKTIGSITYYKVKINSILKGSVNNGYINLIVNEQRTEVATTTNTNKVELTKRYIFKISKADDKNLAFETENVGSYTTTGQILYFDRGDGKIGFRETVNQVNCYFNDESELNKTLQEYCGVKTTSTVEKKSPVSSTRRKNPILNKTSGSPGCVAPFISEYIEGTGNNKSIEVYNPTSSPMSLAGFSILIYTYGSPIPVSISLTGTIPAYGTHVLSHPKASSSILAKTNQTSNSLTFNGSQAIVLRYIIYNIDLIGQIGANVGTSGWVVPPSGSTKLFDLRRKSMVTGGDTTWSIVKNQWTVLPSDSTHNLGHHQNACSTLPDPDFTLSMVNSQITGTTTKYFEFDVTIVGSNNVTYPENIPVHFTYNAATFGNNIVANNNVTVTNGASFSAPTYTTPYTNDDAQNELIAAVNIDFNSFNTVTLYNLTTTTVDLMHVKIKIQNCFVPANIAMVSLDTTKMEAFYYNQPTTDFQTDNIYFYDNVYGLYSNVTQPACKPEITSFSPTDVVGGAYYSGYNGESDLTINGTGFTHGTIGSIGAVYLKSVDGSGGTYTKLDNATDLSVYTDNQIIVTVPSIMFPPNTNKYPATGDFYIITSFGDTAFSNVLSQPVVTIPYSISNYANTITNVKVRYPFTYKTVKDSTTHLDTAAYLFRLDNNTITHNTDVGGNNCRPLTLKAIKTWACTIGIRYRVGADTTITNGGMAADGISYVSFNSTLSNSAFTAETFARPYACTPVSYSGEADVTFKSGLVWQYTNPPTGTIPSTGEDFYTVALHEFGHASLLQHVNGSSDLMYYAPTAGNPIGSIGFEDQTGGIDNVTYGKTVPYTTLGCTLITIPANGSNTCVSPTSGIEKIGNNILELSVYPNPTNTILNVTFSKEGMSNNTVKLTNIIGQTVFYRNIGNNGGANEVINVSELAKGVYVLTVTDGSNTLNKKIIIE